MSTTDMRSSSPGCRSTDLHKPSQENSTLPTSLTNRPKIIGLYGISGSGKTTILKELKRELDEAKFSLYDGSDMLDKLVPGGIEAFIKMNESTKSTLRAEAIRSIGHECTEEGRVGVVAGHSMLWESGAPRSVWTEGDQDTYTHVLYLDVPPEVVHQRCKDDTSRRRESHELHALRKWQEDEEKALRKLCLDHKIFFSTVKEPLLQKALPLIKDIQRHSAEHNISLAEQCLDDAIASEQGRGQTQTTLVLDGDKTLAPQDTGALFWKLQQGLPSDKVNDKDPLKPVFQRLGYSYTAFRQAMLLYEESCDEQQYKTLCTEVASKVTMHPEFVSLFQMVADRSNVGAVVITCGLRRVWEKALEVEGLSDTVQVIGGGRLTDGFVVTAEVKAALVKRLKEHHKKKVWAFGDSPLDLDMLKVADRAIVVVGEEGARSKSMEEDLLVAIQNGLKAEQVLLPPTVPQRLDESKLPQIQLTTPQFADEVFDHPINHTPAHLTHATDKPSAKLLMTHMRNKLVEGPALRAIHHQVGWYLATEYLGDTNIVGLEAYTIPHVGNTLTTGHRILHEDSTTIIALMRAGEPMAFGVSDVLPSAMFVHANEAGDIKIKHLQGQTTVVLVDSVINSGETMLKFLEHIRALHATIRIVVVAGVVQNEVLSSGKIDEYANVRVVALRVSENKYRGVGGMDTGNRLFNTTQFD